MYSSSRCQTILTSKAY
uniref:Uncharacterized protein n=1 Tax=Moniliophthora roreri TaxID=221103 RepID=A0A0W0ETV0_MONRR